MNAEQLKAAIRGGALNAYRDIYSNIADQTERYLAAIDRFVSIYGEREDIRLFSVPGRTEIAGNHTDHNHGTAMGASVECDIIAVAAPSDGDCIRLQSEGHRANTVPLALVGRPDECENFSSDALIAGVCAGLSERGYRIGAFDAYTTSRVLRGSGLSSSAAFEVMIGTIENHLYNGGRVGGGEIAKISKFAENVYYGKPCGLLDQMSCALGGLLYLDFADPDEPVAERLPFPPADEGFVLCIVNTGGSHAALSDEYAAIPAEMKKIAAYFGKEVLRGVSSAELIENAGILRAAAGDRALLRALHFVHECERVEEMRAAIEGGNTDAFLTLVRASGRSSFEYLQNVYVSSLPAEQPLSLALALCDSMLADVRCAYRVHGGGFSGTVQLHLPRELADGVSAVMDATFGEGAAMVMKIRPRGALEITVT